MDISQMRYFLEICNTGSMAKAAANLFVSQQGLSSSIRRLEKEIGCDLFYRKSNNLVLTDAGDHFRREAELIIQKIDRLYTYFEAISKREIRIPIVCTYNILTRCPGKLQQILFNQTDSFKIDFSENWTENCEIAVLEENAAFGIVYGDCDETKFVVHELVSLPQVFIVHKDHPLGKFEEIELNQLQDYPLILPSKKTRPGVILRDMFEEESIRPNTVFECERPLQIIEMICNNPNLVARILANDLLSVDFANIKPLKLKGKPFTMSICLIHKRSRQLNCLESLFKHTALGCFSK